MEPPMATSSDESSEAFDVHNCSKFSCHHDIQLLQQVSILRPWEANRGKLTAAWNEIASELSRQPRFGMNKKSVALRARFESLMTKFIKGEKLSQRRSGTTEEYDERDILLTDIRARIDDYEQVGAEKRQAAKRKTEGIQNSRLVMRQLAMDELASSSSDLPIKKKSKRPAPTVNINALVESSKLPLTRKSSERRGWGHCNPALGIRS
ncbi:hypothetical protein Ae201684P_019928 [Aphanomyces euteiches]|nr:hypothetical protein Ae201684P_019129 [Aphanomyces euteiches]KAH9078854.1 hypothetical protein Ae201684P_019922 [Aphanomyces euteiches]KAH9078861.1 hypothetical protein Ae201684P_019928 [Aphanomyces euteiches]